MIGQKELKDTIINLINSNKLPQFIILIGGYGSGRKTLSKWIATQSNMPYVICGLGVENIRQVIESSYKTTMPTIYIIPNANNLSTIAQNALLKVTEEPPNNAYFILTVENGTQILPTLLNRGISFNMLPYSTEELRNYLLQTYPNDSNHYDTLLDVCDTMGEMSDLLTYDIGAFMQYVDKVIHNIATVNGANAFKISNSLIIKDTDKGYDLGIFLKAFRARCMDILIDCGENKDLRFAEGVVITNKYLQELHQVRGVNKGALFDMWLLDIRKKWM